MVIGVGAKVFRWLSAADPASSHEAARRLWHEDTGLWLIQRADYIAWRDNAGPMLWLHGIRELAHDAKGFLVDQLTSYSWLRKDDTVVGASPP
jgi:hypothetical protein